MLESPLPSPDRARATVWYLAAILCGLAMTVFIRLAATEMHAFQISFFRCFLGALVMVPLAIWLRMPLPSRREWQLHAARALFVAGSMLSGFWALTLIPILETNVLAASAPLFGAIGAAVLLKERVTSPRWLALWLGFSGVVLATRPSLEEIGAGTMLALASALFAAGDWLCLKSLTQRGPAWPIVVVLTALMTPLTLIPALFVWRPPSVEAVLWTGLLALSATAGQYAATRAFALADVSYLASFQFLAFVLAGILGWLAFDEPITTWTMTGGLLIVAGVVHLARREVDLSARVETR